MKFLLNPTNDHPCGVEVNGVAYTPDELEQIITAHQSGETPIVCVRCAHRVLGVFCEVPDCGKQRTGDSPYCKKHDMRFKRHGDPLISLRPWGKGKVE